MREKSKLTSDQWVALLAKEELPAITSIAGILDKFSNDDRSSIPSLSKVILHDQALSSSLLKVANSSSRSPVKRVTTVSRAAIFLGIQSVKNICLTAKVLEGLLNSKHLSPSVYDRLMKLMANAFFAGLLAKMMVPDYDESTQEEVYLAAMMYNIGETSFWSTGNPLTRQLIQKSGMPKLAFEQFCASTAGIKFRELSVGLARTWNLGELLIKSLNQPQSRTKEMNIISLSNQLSEAIGSPPKNKAKFDQLIKDVSSLINVDEHKLKLRIESTRKLAVELLGSYNATELESYIKPLPKPQDFGGLPSPVELANLTIEEQLIIGIKSLNTLTKTSRSMNEFLTHTLQIMSQIFHFHRCSFWGFSQDKQQIECRQSVDSDGEPVRFHYTFALADSQNIMRYAVDQNESIFVENFKDLKWRDYLTFESEQFIERGVLCLSPVKVNSKVVGIISGQIFDNVGYFTEGDFSHFDLIAEHLNLCLSYVSKRLQS
ncbi:HDOD domain-containing protein [Aliiglaciecola sp. 3_MG-2023]|uniref:HDOD domain-containing protein n=1 Tax=Aliiglaciecola sp. 3_MG-2023 TaxID=3062644 RepID=UPI0026E22FD0|nr:HDOD domain-containing protein [Aliiglaciecola sp. 3_MG-2023]MDO6695671.1 HDOD domain-containing protein [Aliiglaciecola sp. 3_MG-2023]